MTALFDAYIIVDWSAAAKPATDANSIWIGVLTRGEQTVATFNPPTRLEARHQILTLANEFILRGQRILIGFDFALGYPSGTARALGLDLKEAAPWRAIHDYLAAHVIEHEDNHNDRFALAADMNAAISGGAHPFWGAPPAKACSTLNTKKGDFTRADSLPEHRLAERWIRSNFKANPKTVWQLLGAGAVGSQSLLGIATVAWLREKISGARLWPFETGPGTMTKQRLENTSCLLAEIYPSTVSIMPETGEILDQAQVKTLSKHLESLDSAGILGGTFDFPDSISDGEIHKIIAEEGWILAK